jgi:calmodulin
VSGKLKKVVLTMITDDIIDGSSNIFSTMEASQILAPARDIFTRLDLDASGDVSVDELKVELSREGYFLTDHEVEQLMTRIDANGDGKIVFDELVSSLLDWNEFETSAQWLKLARRAFQRMDLNGDGMINLEEVISLLPTSLSNAERDEAARSMIREFDTDGDGNISWEEFLNLLMEGSTPASLVFFDKRLSQSSSGSGMVVVTPAGLLASSSEDFEPGNANEDLLYYI